MTLCKYHGYTNDQRCFNNKCIPPPPNISPYGHHLPPRLHPDYMRYLGISPSHADEKPPISQRKWKNLSKWEKLDYIAAVCLMVSAVVAISACVLQFFLEPPIVKVLYYGGIIGVLLAAGVSNLLPRRR